jgi:hypothetical protein
MRTPICLHYGIYTANDIMDFFESEGFTLVHFEKPTGILMKRFSAVFQKNQYGSGHQ